ncbi:MAG TPA: L-lactate dehydrogenase [Candidatus Dependentiae bacterium]|nr:L-lactate dehydrogenase [Candidatus Dependentiae bacterium]HRQ62972.1 L-lactate dehydrogenase [Candidatus Dependentiae bacterium]
MNHKKIAIIGAGSVGTTTAYALILYNTPAEIILIDIDHNRCKGEVLDLADTIGFSSTPGIYSGTCQDACNADIIVIAAGARQKPGQKRSELLETNKKVVEAVLDQLRFVQKHAIVIMVTNPLDPLTWYAQEKLSLPRAQIFGTGTFLDSQRLQGILSQKLNISRESIQAYILGEHGDMQFPAWSITRINEKPLAMFNLSEETLNTIAQETRNKAYEIISCKGATFYGIATCVAIICHAIIFDKKFILPLSIYLENFGVCMSMPAILGKQGIEQVLDITLNSHEQESLARAATVLKNMLK